MTRHKPAKVVKLSVLEFEDKFIPISLFSVAIGVIVIFTFTFPILGILTIPIMIAFIGGILTEGISFVEEPNAQKIAASEEE
ncbi:MAG: hypothetical protein CMA65_03335 [Euryarchaeota archaeon]|nr:hypothetical protein [Euryarchaeota archaeon]|tara:strand:- start:231 stop:476 length:246 start_codon:yes stop_codon:yes gene_type:complete